MHHRRTTSLAGAVLALTCLTGGCSGRAPVIPEPEPSHTTSPRPSSTPTASATPSTGRLAAAPKSLRGEIAREEVRNTGKSGYSRAVVGPADVSGHRQQLTGACVDAQPGGFTFQVLDASTKHSSRSPENRVIARSRLTCDGRVYQIGIDVGVRVGKANAPVQLTVTGGADNSTARGWLVLTNKPVTLH